MDRSLTYFDDVAAIKVSLHLMQKRSGVPLLRFTSTFEVPPSIPFTPTADIHAGSEAHIRRLGCCTSMKACTSPTLFGVKIVASTHYLIRASARNWVGKDLKSSKPTGAMIGRASFFASSQICSNSPASRDAAIRQHHPVPLTPHTPIVPLLFPKRVEVVEEDYITFGK